MIEKMRKDLINDLVTFGLTPVQAQAYLTLLKLGSASAKSVAITSDLNRVDIYRALRHLKRLGVLEEKLGSPTEYVPAEPDQAIEILISSKLGIVEQLRRAKVDLNGRLMSYKSESMQTTDNDGEEDGEMFLKVIYGEQMFRRVQSVVLESQKEIVTIFAPSVMLIYDQMGIPEIEAKRQKEAHIRIRALTKIIPENLNEATMYSKAVELRHSDLTESQLRYTIADDEKLILPVGNPPYRVNEGTALWTNSRILISALKASFESLWKDSIPAEERIHDMKSNQLLEKRF